MENFYPEVGKNNTSFEPPGFKIRRRLIFTVQGEKRRPIQRQGGKKKKATPGLGQEKTKGGGRGERRGGVNSFFGNQIPPALKPGAGTEIWGNKLKKFAGRLKKKKFVTKNTRRKKKQRKKKPGKMCFSKGGQGAPGTLFYGRMAFPGRGKKKREKSIPGPLGKK